VTYEVRPFSESITSHLICLFLNAASISWCTSDLKDASSTEIEGCSASITQACLYLVVVEEEEEEEEEEEKGLSEHEWVSMSE
jgi:hypothetical protein